MQFAQVDTSGQLRLGHQSEQINTTNTGKAQKVWISQLSMGPVLVFTFHFDHTWSLSVYAPSVSAYLKPAPDFRPSTLLILQELWSRQGSHLKGLLCTHTLAVESYFSVCLVFDQKKEAEIGRSFYIQGHSTDMFDPRDGSPGGLSDWFASQKRQILFHLQDHNLISPWENLRRWFYDLK